MCAIAVSSSRRGGGLRLVDPNRDLRQIADLIEESFAGEFGQAGLAAVRDLRIMARLGPLMWFMTRASTEFRDAFSGFVWVEDSRVVGNISLGRVKPTSRRWHISNVAVAKAYRGQGIGRELVQAGLDFIRARNGEWVVLQVRHDNRPALRIYEALRFERLYGTAELSLDGFRGESGAAEACAKYDVHLCLAEDWRRVYDLAIAATPAMARWVRGMEESEFRRSGPRRLREAVGDALVGGKTIRLCASQSDELAGTVWLRLPARGRDAHLQLRVHPDHRGNVETILVTRALSRVRSRSVGRIAAEHSTEHPEGIAALEKAGFKVRRTLITMRRKP